MKKQTAYERFIEDLTVEMRKDPFYDEFHFIKSRASFVRKYDWGWKALYLNRTSDIYSLDIFPRYEVCFNILHKWFEPFDYELRIARQIPSVYYEGYDVIDGMPAILDFIHDKNNYHKLLLKYSRWLLTAGKIVFSEYDSLEDCYRKFILPMLEDDKFSFSSIGESKCFINLAAIKLCDPDRYEEFKPKVIASVTERRNGGSDKSAHYYNHLDEIFDRLENGELKA